MTQTFDTLNLYWGILHCHVSGSLCHSQETFTADRLDELASQIDSLYTFARDKQRFDFLVYADHHNMGSMIATGNTPGSPWRIVRHKADEYSDPGRFVALLGYEFQDGMEYNVYLHDTEALPLAETWAGLIEQVRDDDEHVLLAAHNRPSPTDFNFRRHNRFRLIEILNDGSVFEGWANEGLRLGHNAGFIGGSDDHGCRPGRNACTGVWAEKLSAEAIWEALCARRTVAATGVRPTLAVTVNGAPMGSSVNDAEVFTLCIRHDHDCRPVYVMAVADGQLIHQWQPAEARFAVEHRFAPEVLADRGTLYVKAFYGDGNLAYSSPVFLPGRKRSLQPRKSTVPNPAPAPAIRAQAIEEFGARVGWHRYVNAYSLIPENQRPRRQIRDMVVHTGPDALLVRRTGEIVAPTMDGIVAFDAQRSPTMMHLFGAEHAGLLITALFETDDALIGVGYDQGQPRSIAIEGTLPDVLAHLDPVSPYLYRDRYITPRYIASDGTLIALLSERECTIATPAGRVVAYAQDSYPAMPCAVDMTGLDCIVVLACTGDLIRYDAATAQSASMRWRATLPEARGNMTIVGSQVWCYNRSFEGCYNKDPIEVTCLDIDSGKIQATLTLDLVNIRGTTIRPLGDHRFLALHNPQTNGAAVYRDSLNLGGVIRIYRIDT